MRTFETLGAPAMNASPAEATAHDRDDAALLAAIAERRDREAFAELYARYEQRAYNLARHLTGNADRAAEAAQEAMLRVWTRASNFQPDGNARGWILRIVARESMRTSRKRRAEYAEEGHDMDSHAQGARAAGASKLAQDEELDVLRRSLERLPEVYRRIVALYYGAGMSQREIGEELDVSQRTVSTQLEEALKRLRSMLGQAGVATAAPLLGSETIFSALSTGHLPPAGLGEATLEHLSDAPVHEGQVSRALSRKGAAAGGSSALWIAGALAIVAAAAGGWWMLQEPEAPKPTGAAKMETPKAGSEINALAPPLEKPGLIGRWTFEKGPPEGFEIVRGEWTWQAPKDGKPGAMHCPGRVWVLPPVKIPQSLPIAIRFRFHPANKSGQFNFSVFLTDGETIFSRKLWKPPEVKVDPRDEFVIEEYIVGNFTAGMFAGEKLIYGAEAFEHKARGWLCLAFVNFNIYEIEMRSVTPEELPPEIRNLDATVKALGVEPIAIPAEPLRGED